MIPSDAQNKSIVKIHAKAVFIMANGTIEANTVRILAKNVLNIGSINTQD